MKYFVNLGAQNFEVEVRDRAGKLEATVDGVVVDYSYAEVDRAGQVALLIEKACYGVSIAGSHNDYDVTIAGHRYAVLIEDERERAAHAAEREKQKGGGLVKAVMPGVIVALNVAEGDVVEEGQPLLILEAMKMQNEIGAPGQGRVKRLFVAAGDAVAAGAKLVELEALPDSV